ncbi:hypothetical protein [Streptosporangium sp. NPDC002721]|uniref:hypothetical protein n=1 Tax=Streptosporangium sp. NPDC002721 TaxID=3366188 RepID=UPI0036A56E01
MLAAGVVMATVVPLLLPDPNLWWIIGLGLGLLAPSSEPACRPSTSTPDTTGTPSGG